MNKDSKKRYIPTVGVDYGSKEVQFEILTPNQHNKKDEGEYDNDKDSNTITSMSIPIITNTSTYVTRNIDFFDLSGDHEYIEIRNEFYKDNTNNVVVGGIFLVYDICNLESFDALDKWLREGERYGLDLHNTPIVLCANKIDQESTMMTTMMTTSSTRVDSMITKGNDSAKNHRMPFFETSALDGTNVMSMFECLFQKATTRTTV